MHLRPTVIIVEQWKIIWGIFKSIKIVKLDVLKKNFTAKLKINYEMTLKKNAKHISL